MEEIISKIYQANIVKKNLLSKVKSLNYNYSHLMNHLQPSEKEKYVLDLEKDNQNIIAENEILFEKVRKIEGYINELEHQI